MQGSSKNEGRDDTNAASATLFSGSFVDDLDKRLTFVGNVGASS